MKLSKNLATAFNQQVTAELEAAIVYRQIAYHLDALGLVGMRHWMYNQAAEEVEHAQLFSNHLLARGVTPTIETIAGPALEIGTAIDAFEASLKHERYISDKIRNLAKMAQEEGDFDSRPLLDRFLDEQIEEEATVSGILDRLRLIGEDGSGLLRIDAELGSRGKDHH